jgi:hypothetical protein
MMGTKEGYKQKTEGRQNSQWVAVVFHDVQDVQQVSVLYITFRKHMDFLKLVI